MRGRFSKILIGGVAVASMCIQPGHAAPGNGLAIIAGPDAKTLGYATPVMTIRRGDPLSFINLDIEAHNVQSDAFGPDSQPWCDGNFPLGKCPLLFSPEVGLGQTPDIRGTENLVPGNIYTFWCVAHGHGQSGTLVVLPE